MGGVVKSMLNAQKIAKNAEDLKQELAATVIKGQDPAGEVVSEFSGMGKPLVLKISESILVQGSDAVSWAATQAMIDAYSKSRSAMIQRTESLCDEISGSLDAKSP